MRVIFTLIAAALMSFSAYADIYLVGWNVDKIDGVEGIQNSFGLDVKQGDNNGSYVVKSGNYKFKNDDGETIKHWRFENYGWNEKGDSYITLTPVGVTGGFKRGDIVTLIATTDKNQVKVVHPQLFIIKGGEQKVLYDPEEPGQQTNAAIADLDPDNYVSSLDDVNRYKYILDDDYPEINLCKKKESNSTAMDVPYISVVRPVKTAIENVIAESDDDAPMYNIYGVRVDSSYKGLVIKNGKKFILR